MAAFIAIVVDFDCSFAQADPASIERCARNAAMHIRRSFGLSQEFGCFGHALVNSAALGSESCKPIFAS